MGPRRSAISIWRVIRYVSRPRCDMRFAHVQLFAMHPIKAPAAVRSPISAAELFTWRGRETIAIASGSSVWVGWRHDSTCTSPLQRTYTRLTSSNSGTSQTTGPTYIFDGYCRRLWVDPSGPRREACCFQLERNDPYFGYFYLAHGWEITSCQDESSRS